MIFFRRVHDKLDNLTTEILRLQLAVEQLNKQEISMTAALQALADQVKKNTDLEASAVQLIQGLASQIAAQAQDPVAIADLASQLQASATALSSAITANTPAPTPAA